MHTSQGYLWKLNFSSKIIFDSNDILFLNDAIGIPFWLFRCYTFDYIIKSSSFRKKPMYSILCYWYIRFDYIRWKSGVINNKNSTTKYSQQNKPHFSACRLSHVTMLPQTDLISETDRLSANLKNKRVWWDGWWKSTINVPKVILLVYIKSRNPQKNPEDRTSQAPSPIN